jgi:hypothetical protein
MQKWCHEYSEFKVGDVGTTMSSHAMDEANEECTKSLDRVWTKKAIQMTQKGPFWSSRAVT